MYISFCIYIPIGFVETVEESSFLKSEIDRLAKENERLRAETLSSHSQSSHSPQVCAVNNRFHYICTLVVYTLHSAVWFAVAFEAFSLLFGIHEFICSHMKYNQAHPVLHQF